ncbi:DUF642 domain-containing protein [Aliagarivorans marinus]|uniref:DUF642 domain-containing protein n=1 Tax=Aliagarivorans marinus TaxID=561965 RepID=UPI0004147B59|nr:DUF642 domain-containing protein [Aliagarivorans marinus]
MQRFILALICTVTMTSANANLLLNGSFEDNSLKQGKWAYFNSDDVQGWSGDNIEIWHNMFSIDATDGQQHIELNAHCNNKGKPCPEGNYQIFQAFDTNPGQIYQFGFDYRARTKQDERFAVSIINDLSELLYYREFDDHTRRMWNSLDAQFTADSQGASIHFQSLTSGRLGNLIDDVYVESQPLRLASFASVNEPDARYLLLIALIWLALGSKIFGIRKRLKAQA